MPTTQQKGTDGAGTTLRLHARERVAEIAGRGGRVPDRGKDR
jgi:hypothetical protein